MRGGYSILQCPGFLFKWLLLYGAQALDAWASGVASVGLVVAVHRLQSVGSVVVDFRADGMWDLPGSGIEPVSPAWAGRFLTTVPPGKSTM